MKILKTKELLNLKIHKNIWRPPSLSELTPIILFMELGSLKKMAGKYKYGFYQLR